MGLKEVKVPIGMVSSYWYPIVSEPVGAHPVYGAKTDMGAAVKGVLGVTTNTLDIPGDDEILVHDEAYVSHQMDVETTLDDLERNAILFGHSFTDGVETAGKDDKCPYGAYGFIQSLLNKDKSRVYRAVFFYKMSALQSSEKIEADTKGTTLTYKNHPVSLFGQVDNTGSWRARKDYSALADAEAFLELCAGATNKYRVELELNGTGTADKSAATMVTSGTDYTVTFSAVPTKVYDRSGGTVTDVTNSLNNKTLTLSNVTADHKLIVIF